MSGACEYEGGDRARVRMGIGLPPRFERPIRSFFVTPQAKQCERPRRANGIHHRIERTQIARYVRRLDRRSSIARLRMDAMTWAHLTRMDALRAARVHRERREVLFLISVSRQLASAP